MAGRTPKPPHLRQRRNRASTRAKLPSQESAARRKVPPLPPRRPAWHPQVREWWKAVWQSPMAAEYLVVDKHALYLVADLHHEYWSATDAALKLKLGIELRHQDVRFGLTPIDRRRLQWEVEKAEQAQERRKTWSEARDEEKWAEDPRDLLKLEK